MTSLFAQKTMKNLPARLVVLAFLVIWLAACGPARAATPSQPVGGDPAEQSSASVAPTPLPSETPTPSATDTPLPTHTPSPTDTPSPSPTPLPTDTPTPTVTPTWTWYAADQLVTVPILLYHHVTDETGLGRYNVPPENFRQQMQALHDWGYTSLTPSALVDVLTYGGELPPHPVIITFDDGDLDVYTNAFPIMQEMGFVGAFYIVGERLTAEGFVSTEQLQEMVAAGWEIGSHSMTHLDLTLDHSVLREEMLDSRTLLEEELGVPIHTFAYPFGLVDDRILEKVADYGYLAGMGLGTSNVHGAGNLYYLNRREVHADFDLVAFAALLP